MRCRSRRSYLYHPEQRDLAGEKPGGAVRNFYAWYVHEVANGSRPLEKERQEMRKFVTDRLLNCIDKMPNGPGGLDGDFFLNTQEVDPEWEKNIAVSNNYVGRTMSKLGVILTDRKLGDRQIEVHGRLTRQNSATEKKPLTASCANA